jgi:hypothetical protein
MLKRSAVSLELSWLHDCLPEARRMMDSMNLLGSCMLPPTTPGFRPKPWALQAACGVRKLWA